MYGVYWNDQPASVVGYPEVKGEGWENHQWSEFQKAVDYANDWLQYPYTLPMEVEPDVIYELQDNCIEIRTMED